MVLDNDVVVDNDVIVNNRRTRGTVFHRGVSFGWVRFRHVGPCGSITIIEISMF